MKKAKFYILFISFCLLALADGALTFINTPDLSNEGNPLVSVLGLGWAALAIANLLNLVLLFFVGRFSFIKYKTVYTNETKFTAYCSQILYDRPDKFWTGLIPKHFKPILACFGYSILYTSIVSRLILVIEWLCITFDISLADKYFYIDATYFNGNLYLWVACVCSAYLAIYWFYKEYKKQLRSEK